MRKRLTALLLAMLLLLSIGASSVSEEAVCDAQNAVAEPIQTQKATEAPAVVTPAPTAASEKKSEPTSAPVQQPAETAAAAPTTAPETKTEPTATLVQQPAETAAAAPTTAPETKTEPTATPTLQPAETPDATPELPDDEIYKAECYVRLHRGAEIKTNAGMGKTLGTITSSGVGYVITHEMNSRKLQVLFLSGGEVISGYVTDDEHVTILSKSATRKQLAMEGDDVLRLSDAIVLSELGFRYKPEKQESDTSADPEQGSDPEAPAGPEQDETGSTGDEPTETETPADPEQGSDPEAPAGPEQDETGSTGDEPAETEAPADPEQDGDSEETNDAEQGESDNDNTGIDTETAEQATFDSESDNTEKSENNENSEGGIDSADELLTDEESDETDLTDDENSEGTEDAENIESIEDPALAALTDGLLITDQPVETSMPLLQAKAAPEPKLWPITVISTQQTEKCYYTGRAHDLRDEHKVEHKAAIEKDYAVTWSFRSDPADEYSKAYPLFTDAGSYTVYYKVSAADHESVEGSYTVTITGAAATIQAGSANKNYDGTQLTCDTVMVEPAVVSKAHAFDVEMTEESTASLVGVTPNVIAKVDGVSVSPDGVTDIGNYRVTVKSGKLTVKGIPVEAALSEISSVPAVGYANGSPISYSLAVTSIAADTLTDLAVTAADAVFTPTAGVTVSENGHTAVIEALGSECTQTLILTHIVTDHDLIAGSYTASASVRTSDGTVSAEAAASLVEALDITLTAEMTAAPADDVCDGDTVTYNMLVRNDGNITYSDVCAFDTLTGLDETVASLAPGESFSCTGTYTADEADVRSGSIVNHLEASAAALSTGVQPFGKCDAESITAAADAAFNLQLSIVSAPRNAVCYNVDEVIYYELRVQNTGALTLNQITIDGFAQDSKVEAVSEGEAALKQGVLSLTAPVMHQQEIIVYISRTVTVQDLGNCKPGKIDLKLNGKAQTLISEETVQANSDKLTADIAMALLIYARDSLGNYYTGGSFGGDGYDVSGLMNGHLIDRVVIHGKQSEVGYYRDELEPVSARVIDLNGTNVSSMYYMTFGRGDLEILHSYYRLTIHYWYDRVGGNKAALDFSMGYDKGDYYVVTSPNIAGYKPKYKQLSGRMGSDTEINVIYTPIKHILTVHFVYADGEEAADDYEQTVATDAEYRVIAPMVDGYNADQAVLTGVMPPYDTELTVVYLDNTEFVDLSRVNVATGGSAAGDSYGLVIE